MPNHIVLLGRKGGVGKTTSVVYLAVAAAEAGHRVAVVDADHHQWSAAKWAEEAQQVAGGPLPFTVERAGPQEAAKAARRLAEGGTTVIVDTPPGAEPDDLVALLDGGALALMPVAPTQREVGQVLETQALATRAGTLFAVMVVRAFKRRLATEEFLAALSDGGIPWVETVIYHREPVAQAVWPLSGPAREDNPDGLWGYRQAWQEIEEALS